jgi:protein SCO1/2
LTIAMTPHASLRRALVSLVTSALVFLGPGCGRAQTPSAAHLPGLEEPTAIAIPDITLTDQDNRKVTLYKDVMEGKLVLLSFFYTTCQGICPTSAHWLSKLQDRLGERLGKDVILLSITMDPETDTPEKLNRWGKGWQRKPGWTLLTSKGNELRELMKRFKPYPSTGFHSATVFVGDGTQNPVRWVALDILSEGDFVLDYLRRTSPLARPSVPR